MAPVPFSLEIIQKHTWYYFSAMAEFTLVVWSLTDLPVEMLSLAEITVVLGFLAVLIL